MARSELPPDLLAGSEHGRHGSGLGAGNRHQFPALAGRTQQVRQAKGGSGTQGGQLAKAVPGQAGGLDPQFTHQSQQCQAARPQGRLRPGRFGQPGRLCGLFLLRKGGAREDNLVQAHVWVERQSRGLVPDLAHAIEVHCQVLSHADVLASLSREQQRQLPRLAVCGQVDPS